MSPDGMHKASTHAGAVRCPGSVSSAIVAAIRIRHGGDYLPVTELSRPMSVYECYKSTSIRHWHTPIIQLLV